MARAKIGGKVPDLPDDDEKLIRGGITSTGSNMLHLAESLVSKFDGRDGVYNVSDWIQEIEDNGDVFSWTPTQRLLVARRSLTGTAALWLRAEKAFKTWDELKAAICNEFPDGMDAKKVHEMLSTRRKRHNESCLDYMLTMKALGRRGNLSDSVTIKYIVDGIIDAEINKVMLYGVTSYPELKEKFKIYEAIKSKVKPAEKQNRSIVSTSGGTHSASVYNSKGGGGDGRFTRCYSCGEKSHVSAECPHKSQGRKCFNCNEFGHVSAECKKRREREVTSLTSRRVLLNSTQEGSTLYEGLSTVLPTEMKCDGESSTLIGRSNKMEDCNDCAGKDGRNQPLDIYGIENVNKHESSMLSREKPVKCVEINKKPVSALIDSGSDINLMCIDCFTELQLPSYDTSMNVTMSGLGLFKMKALGTISTQVCIDGSVYDNVTFHVVPKQSMPFKLLLGNEFLRRVVIVMKDGCVWVNPTYEWLCKMDCVVSTVDCVGQAASEAVKEEVIRLAKNYQPCQIKEAPIVLKIIMRDDIPVAQRPRRISPREQQEVDRQIKEWLQNGIIRVSFSEYASPLVLVKKKDGSTRVCIDFRQVNRKMVKDEYPLPNIDDHIDKLASAKVFSALDLKNGYFHLKIHEDSVKYTAFVTMTGQYEFLRAPFGLATCPKVFTRFITIIFRELIARGVVVIFIDDILIPAQDEHQAMERLQEVLKIASEYGLNINWDKSQLLTRRVEYLGHIIEDGAVRPSPGKTDAVMRFPEPQSLKQLHSFLGLCSYFRKFIPNYAQIAKPLTDMLRKECKFQFNEEHRMIFNELKMKLSTKPVLKIFDQKAETELHTDASAMAYSAILMQRSSDGELHPIHYMSRRTSDAESKYTSYELEALAIIEGVKKFRHYLFGNHFKIVTDCKAFEMTLNKKDLAMSTRVARWILLLQDYDFKIEHRSGIRMKHTDALSRNPYVSVVTLKLHDDIRRAQETDDSLRVIMELLKRGESIDNYYLHKELLYKGPDHQLVIPTKMELEIIKRAHDNGHFARKKTLELISKDYHIQDIVKKVEEYIRTCIPCLLASRKQGKQEGFLNSIEKGDTPLHTLHLDHIGPLTETRKQYNHILTIVDAFTKYTWLFPTKTTATKEVLNKLELHQQIFGNPERIISDRGTAFTSNDFKEYCDKERIEHITITTGVPRGNGQVERMHHTIISVLTKLCIEKPDLWYRHVGRVQTALNSTFQRSVNTTPFELLIGKKMKRREDIEIYTLLQNEIRENYIQDREELRKRAKQQILDVQVENKKSYDEKRKESRKYKEGEMVAIKRTQFGPGLKLKPKYLGPYRVTRVKRNDRYDVEKVDTSAEGPSKTSSSADHMKSWPG